MSDNNSDRFIFFAWQSDLPATSNTNPIRNGLRKAIKKIGNGLVYDHATRKMSGSEDVAASIRTKIEAADIFVADISTIRKAYKGRRAVQNPNVVFELGYAVAHLGWSRIILMFNEKHGKLDTDLPFDFQSNRVARFTMDDAPTKAQKDSLNALLLAALSEIESTNPKRPAELKGKSTAQVNHERDSQKMKWLLEHVHFPTLDSFLADAPHMVSHRVFDFFYDFQSVFINSLWHLNDATLQAILDRFYSSWETALSFGERYDLNNAGSHYIFQQGYGLNEPAEVKAAWEAIRQACADMHKAQQELLSRVRSEYSEIDIMDTNETAWNKNVAFQKSMKLDVS